MPPVSRTSFTPARITPKAATDPRGRPAARVVGEPRDHGHRTDHSFD
ncbi:hypothetical protein [Streptomyces sp. NPDC004014]